LRIVAIVAAVISALVLAGQLFYPSKDSNPHAIPWPSQGDVEIDFSYVRRRPPEGACGANATVVLTFKHERVAKISEGLNVGACM
jgi:hypothetical protein